MLRERLALLLARVDVVVVLDLDLDLSFWSIAIDNVSSMFSRLSVFWQASVVGDSLEAFKPGRLILTGVKELVLSGFCLLLSLVAHSLGLMTTMPSGTVLRLTKDGLVAWYLTTLLRSCISGVRRWL